MIVIFLRILLRDFSRHRDCFEGLICHETVKPEKQIFSKQTSGLVCIKVQQVTTNYTLHWWSCLSGVCVTISDTANRSGCKVLQVSKYTALTWQSEMKPMSVCLVFSFPKLSSANLFLYFYFYFSTTCCYHLPFFLMWILTMLYSICRVNKFQFWLPLVIEHRHCQIK